MTTQLWCETIPDRKDSVERLNQNTYTCGLRYCKEVFAMHTHCSPQRAGMLPVPCEVAHA